MQSNPGPRPTVGSHSAIETVISGAYARDEKRVMRTNEERLWSLWHVRGTVHRHLMGKPNRLSAL